MVCLDGVSCFDFNCFWICLVNEVLVIYNCIEEGYKICYFLWFGFDCVIYCEFYNDEKYGYYICNVCDGSKVCLDGWEGCDCCERSVKLLFIIE